MTDLPKILIVQDELFQKHVAPHSHPERPHRLQAIQEQLAAASFVDQLVPLAPVLAEDADLLAVHTPAHVERIHAIKDYSGSFDADTYYCRDSWNAASHAAGSVAMLARKLIQGPEKRAFALVRPPGHHATPSQAMGFCLLNNAAIAAQIFADALGGPVVVIDWDVHHGNGTQDIFWHSQQVVYVSTHQFPFYPGSGAASEIGEHGYTYNFPLPSGTHDGLFESVLVHGLERIIEHHKPKAFVLSAGYDQLGGDMLGGLDISTAAIRRLSAWLDAKAKELDAPILATLEGGYTLDLLAEGVHRTIDAWANPFDPYQEHAAPELQKYRHWGETMAIRRPWMEP